MSAAIAGLLGTVAQGYEQARQIDTQRQFEAEQNRRAQYGQFLQKIALDETAHPQSRNAAIQEYFKLSQTPSNKPYKLNPDALITPAQPAQTTQGPPQQMQLSSPPAPQGALAGSVPGGTLGQNISLPPIPTQATLAGTPGGVFMPPEQIAQHQATILEAQTRAQEVGKRQAIMASLQSFLQAHPEMENDPTFRQIMPFMAMGMQMPYGMYRMQMAGPRVQMTAAQARADARYTSMVPPNIADNEMVNVQFSQGMQPLGVLPTTPTSLLGSQKNGWVPTTDADGNTYLVPVQTQVNKTLPGGQPASAGQGTQGQGKPVALPPIPTQAGAAAPAPAAGAPAPSGTVPKGARKIGHKPGVPMIVPGEGNQPTMAAVTPGQTVPEGSVTPQQYGSANIPTTPVRTRAQMSQAQLPSIAALENEIQNQKDNLGPLVGRINAFMQGNVGAGDPDYSYLSTKLGLVNTAMMMIHAGGRPAFGLMKKFDDKLNAGKMDAPTLLAGLRAIREQMEIYAKEGKMQQFSPTLPEVPKNAPKFGEIQDGHIYLGGDPANQASWKKVTK